MGRRVSLNLEVLIWSTFNLKHQINILGLIYQRQKAVCTTKFINEAPYVHDIANQGVWSPCLPCVVLLQAEMRAAVFLAMEVQNKLEV